MIYNLSYNIYEIIRDFYREDNMHMFKYIILKIYELLKNFVNYDKFWKY